MSSRPKRKTFLKTIGFRLTAWYSGIFILSAVFLFGFSYLNFSRSLAKQDQRSIASELKELATLYEMGGVAFVEKKVTVYKKFEKKKPFLVRIGGPSEETILLILPSQWMDFDIKELVQVPSGSDISWAALHNQNGKENIEVGTIPLPDNRVLQVGKSLEDREKILGHFLESFLLITIPLIALAFAGGTFLTLRILRPLRDIINAVRFATDGKMDTRIPSAGVDDELEELITLFNEMLHRIEGLMQAMRNAMDNVAHDLRTPMTRLRGAAEVALTMDNDPDKCREALADCIEESERILRMLNTLMDISEAETGAMRLDLEPVNICKVLEDIGESYRYIGENREISIHLQCEQDLWVSADPTRIYQIISNLCENAIKYTDFGGRIDINATAIANEIFITVKDTGRGIPQEDLPRIWNRSFRCDQSRSQSGLGLGLSLVKAFVEAHDGRVDVTSEAGKGSTFTIILPGAR